MEDGKRKKKIKKKKGKATKTVDNVISSSGEALQDGPEGGHEPVPEQNDQEPDPGAMGNQNVSVSESEAESERHKVKELKSADIEGIIRHLENNIVSCVEKEANLENKIELLQNENEFFLKKEVSWNLKFDQLQSEMHSWSAKEASLEDRLNSIESEKDSRIWENSINEMVARLEEANTGLQMQVKELERSRDNIIQENQQLTNSVLLLEARVQHLENEAASFRLSTATMIKHISEEGETEKHVEPVSESPELDTVEPEFVRKANQHSGTGEHSATFPVPSTDIDEMELPAAYLSPHETKISESTNESAYSSTLFETINITDANENHIAGAEVHTKLRLLDELNGSAEIVQIPLDDSPIQLVEPQGAKIDEKTDVPLSDAPLIGAPFRLISFVAKYVSGADLVKESRHSSGQ